MIASDDVPNDTSRLRVLMSAYACEPHRGSEQGQAWEAVRAIARLHDLTVVTRSMYAAPIAAEVDRVGGDLSRVRFEFLDVDVLPEAWLDRRGWGENLVYLAWQGRLRSWLRDRTTTFDLAHHVSFVRYWMAPGIAGFDSLPIVFGPVGGADSSPPALLRSLSPRGRRAERLRDAVRAVFTAAPALRRAMAGPGVYLATSPATADALRRLGAADVRLAPDVNVPADSLPPPPAGPPPGPPVVIGAGRMIEWKAYHLALQAWARAGIPGTLELYGDGPSRERLQWLAVELGVADRVHLPGRVPRSELFAALGRAHAFVHPSLHDSGGFAIVEALQHGVPVVCWDHAGPGQMIDGSCGAVVTVDPYDLDRSVDAMAEAFRRLVLDEAAWRSASTGAHERVATLLNTAAHAERLDAAYRAAVADLRSRRTADA